MCCTAGSAGSTCRPSSASARAGHAGGVWTSGNARVCGIGCTRCCLGGCAPLISSTGVARSSMAAMCRQKGGHRNEPSPVDRGRLGSKHHLIVDAQGIPLAWTLSGGTATTPLNSSHCLTASHASAAGPALPAAAEDSYSLTAPTTTPAAAANSASAASSAHRPPPTRARLRTRPQPLGRRTHLPGSTATAASPSATTATPTCTKPSSPSPAA